jgi:hypothetical protein
MLGRFGSAFRVPEAEIILCSLFTSPKGTATATLGAMARAFTVPGPKAIGRGLLLRRLMMGLLYCSASDGIVLLLCQ